MSLVSTAISVVGSTTNNINPVTLAAGTTTVSMVSYSPGTVFQIPIVADATVFTIPLPSPAQYAGSSWKFIVAGAPASNTALIRLGTAAGANIWANLIGPNPVNLAVSSLVTLGITGATSYAVGDNFEVTSYGNYWIARYASSVGTAGMIVRTA